MPDETVHDVTIVEASVPELPEAPALAEPVGGSLVPAGASELQLRPEQQTILRAAQPPANLDILPTGEIYLSQIRYRKILFDAFGVGAVTLVPVSPYFRVGQTLCREWSLYVQGKFVAQAIGEADYYPNARTSWATAAESAKSNALMRCCKDLGIAQECWDKRFTEAFKTEHCVKVAVEVEERGVRKLKAMWRRQDAEPFRNERGPITDAPSTGLVRQPQRVHEPTEGGQGQTDRALPPADAPVREPGEDAAEARTEPPPAPARSTEAKKGQFLISDPQRKRLFAILRNEGQRTEEDLRTYLARTYGLEGDSTWDMAKGIPKTFYDRVVGWVQGREER